jgi:hypothetical protein
MENKTKIKRSCERCPHCKRETIKKDGKWVTVFLCCHGPANPFEVDPEQWCGYFPA